MASAGRLYTLYAASVEQITEALGRMESYGAHAKNKKTKKQD